MPGFLASKAEPVDVDQIIRRCRAVHRRARTLRSVLSRLHAEAMGRRSEELDKSVTARIPTRINDDDRYFDDQFQMMPLHGFTHMFENMLDHPNITLMLG